MPYSLSLISPDRKEFVFKVYTEILNEAASIVRDTHNNNSSSTYRKIKKTTFLSSVVENNELFEIEKQYCKERFIYDFELENAFYKLGEPRECNRCKATRYSDKYCEQCISLHLQSLFNTWTSGNKIIDDFIHQCQIQSSLPTHILEWIPFDQFIKIKKLTEGGFSSIYTATWARGYLCDYDENKKEFTCFGLQLVVLKGLNNSSNLGKTFFNEVIN